MKATAARPNLRVTSVKWPDLVDARLRILVNLATTELGRPTSAAEVLAGLIVKEPLDGRRAAKAAKAANPRRLREIERENAQHVAQSGPQRGRPRSSSAPTG